MEIIFYEILRKLGYLLIAGMVLFTHKQTYDHAKGGVLKGGFVEGHTLVRGYYSVHKSNFKNPTCKTQTDPLYDSCK